LIEGVPSGFVLCMIRSTMNKYLVAAVLFAATTFPAGPFLVGELTTSVAPATLTSRCTTRPDVPCGPARREWPPRAAAWSDPFTAAIEPEKWALLLLEFCAAGWVLARSERSHTRRGARFQLLFDELGSPFADTAIGVRPF
jgi:hypothetical protein